jgi:sugar (pentulose or hexulose) kinase
MVATRSERYCPPRKGFDRKAPPLHRLSGGIQRSLSSLQRLVDVLNQPLYPNDEPEATLKRAAVYVLEKLDVSVPQMLTQIIRPNPSAAEAYAAARQRQQKLAEHFEAWPI